jgi:hypothetical protein
LNWRIKPQKQLAFLDWYVSTKPDPILADEQMGMLVLQDRPLTIQPFEMTQLANAGLWDESDFVKSINQKAASAILIHHFMHYPVYTTLWTPAMLEAISENYAVTTNAADTLIFEPYDDVLYGPLNPISCPGAPWDLPTKSEMGMWWISRQLILMGMGEEDNIPVYAIADGELTRKQGWVDVVAIKHENPFEPGQFVWVYYSGMASADRSWSYIVPELPTGSESVHVHKGQLLGYQGRFRNKGIWVHLGLTIVKPMDDGSSPPYQPELWYENVTLQQDQLPEEGFVDPSSFLGIKPSPVMGEPVWLPLQCQIPTP